MSTRGRGRSSVAAIAPVSAMTSVTAVALVAAVALAAWSAPSAAGLWTRTDVRLPWKSPLGPFGKPHHRPTATTTRSTATGPVPTTYVTPTQKQQQRKPPRGAAAAGPTRGPAAAYAPATRPPARPPTDATVPSATVTPRPGLESTTHDRAIITAPLKRCPEGQRMGPDRNCRPNFTDPEDETD